MYYQTLHSQPDRKLFLFEKRVKRLCGAIKQGEASGKIANAAEGVRRAAMGLVKAKRDLIRQFPRRDSQGAISKSLDDEEQQWLSLSIEDIITEYGQDPERRAKPL